MAKGTLKGYEAHNLIVFLCFILGLGGIGALVFQLYKDKDKVPPKEIASNGILTEVVSPTANSCYFYLENKLSETTQKYHTRKEIPPSDDGLAKAFFDIPGVIEVTIDKTMVVLQKSPKAHWEEIRPAARDIISARLHLKK
jgi:hypothetical protein